MQTAVIHYPGFNTRLSSHLQILIWLVTLRIATIELPTFISSVSNTFLLSNPFAVFLLELAKYQLSSFFFDI